MSDKLAEQKLVNVSNDLGSLRNDLKGLYYALENNWDRELEELLAVQPEQELGPKYYLKHRKYGLMKMDGFKTAEELVKFYNSSVKDRSGYDHRFIVGKVKKGRGEEIAREFEKLEDRTAVVRGDSWAVDVYNTLSKSDPSSRKNAREAARSSLEDIDFKDFVKPWKEPKYSDLKKIVAGFKTGYWESYESKSQETLQTVVLQSVAESFNPDRSAPISFYRGLINEYSYSIDSEETI